MNALGIDKSEYENVEAFDKNLKELNQEIKTAEKKDSLISPQKPSSPILIDSAKKSNPEDDAEPQIENHFDDTPEKKNQFGKRSTNFYVSNKDIKELSETASPGKGAIMDSIDALWGSTGGQSQEIAKQNNEKDERLFERRGAEQRNAQLDKDV